MQPSVGKNRNGRGGGGGEQKFVCMGWQNTEPALTDLSLNYQFYLFLPHPVILQSPSFVPLGFISSKTRNQSSVSDSVLSLPDRLKNKRDKPSSRDSFLKLPHSSSVLARVFLSMPEKTSSW